MTTPGDSKPVGAVPDERDGKPGIAGPGSVVIPGPAVPQGSGSHVERAADVLDGELITNAEYALRRGLHRLPVLAMAAVFRDSDRPKDVTKAVISRVTGSALFMSWAKVT